MYDLYGHWVISEKTIFSSCTPDTHIDIKWFEESEVTFNEDYIPRSRNTVSLV
jgi:hypothetical protein